MITKLIDALGHALSWVARHVWPPVYCLLWGTRAKRSDRRPGGA